MYKTFLIKYAEIAIKGKNRYIFEDALVKNIKYQLRNVDGSFEVRKESGRVYVETDGDYDYDETVATLSRMFWYRGYLSGRAAVRMRASTSSGEGSYRSYGPRISRIRALPSR